MAPPATRPPRRWRGVPRRVLALGLWMGLWLVAAHLVVEALGLRFVQAEGNPSIATLAAFAERPERLDVVFVGSSRIRADVSISAFETLASEQLGREVRGFNLGVHAGGTVDAWVVVRDLLLAGEPPALIVLGIGARALNDNNPRYTRTIERVLGPRDLFGPAGPRVDRWPELAAGIRTAFRAPETLLWAVTPGAREVVAAGRDLRGSEWTPPEVAWRGALPPAAEDLEALVGPAAARAHIEELERRTRGRTHIAREVLLEDYAPEGRPSRALRELGALCRARGVDLVVWNLPVSRPFQAGAYANGEDERFLTTLTALCRDEGIELQDLSGEPFRLPDPFFHDGDHLGPIGADAFTRMVTAELLVPRLRRAP